VADPEVEPAAVGAGSLQYPLFGTITDTYGTAQPAYCYDGVNWNWLAVDAEAVPAGGTTGQVLTKTSGADYATAWQTPAPTANYVQLTSSGQTWTVPAGVTAVEFTVAQGGCGGGGGSGGPGGGGAAGMAFRFRWAVTPGDVYKANAIGAGGAGGAGNTSGTTAGGNGATGGQTQLYKVNGSQMIGRSPLNECFGGVGGTAANATYTNAGQYGGNPLFQTATYSVPSNPGSGGVGGYTYPAPTPFATLGGHGGIAAAINVGGPAQRPPGTPAQPGDPQPASYPYEEFPTARTGGGGNAGWGQLNGETATQPGCGGGGGGGWGTTAGSVGGNGGNGAPGFIEIRW
jgi:hypothetical protein